MSDRPTRADAILWKKEKRELELDIDWYKRMIRQNLRESWSTFRGVFEDEAHPTPWKMDSEPDYRGMLQRMVTAAELEFREDHVASIAYPEDLRKMFGEAYRLLRDNE